MTQDFICTITNLSIGESREVVIRARSPENAASILCRRKFFRRMVLTEDAIQTRFVGRESQVVSGA